MTTSIPILGSRDDASSTTFDSGIKSFWTAEAVSGSAKGGARYRRVNSEPAIPASLKVRSLDHYLADGVTVDDTNGGWWRLDVDEVRPSMANARYDGATDDSQAFNDADSISPYDVRIGNTGMGSVIANTIAAEYDVDFTGRGDKSVLMTATGGSLENIVGSTDADHRKRLFRLNINGPTGTTWTTPFPGVSSNKIRNFRMTAATSAPSATNPAGYMVTAFEFGGSQLFEDLRFSYFERGVRQLGNVYSDLVTARRLTAFAQINNSASNYRTGYLVELPYSGDGVVTSQVICYGQDEKGGKTRGKAVYYRLKVGGTIEHILNGDVVVEDSHQVSIRNLHMESGMVRILNSSGELHDSVFYSRGGRLVDGDDVNHITPVVFEQLAGNNAVHGMVQSVRNLTFYYFNKTSGTTWAYNTDLPNFTLQGNGAALGAHLSFENIVRADCSDTNQQQKVYLGSTCGDADFDNYTHLASRRSAYRNGVWEIAGKIENIPASTGLFGVTVDSQNHRVWRGPNAPVFYRAVALYDRVRMCGRAGSTEFSPSTNPALDGACIALSVENGWRRPVMVRLYRGATAGSYDRYVDVALISGSILYDNWEDVGGFAWCCRAAGPIDALNSSLVDGFDIGPGIVSTASDAYGNVIVRANAPGLPTVGGWRAGDEIRLTNPTGVTTQGLSVKLLGYRRLTHCTSAASTNLPGIDWLPMYTMI